MYVTAAKLANALCTKLIKEADELEKAEGPTPIVIGFDIEWLVTFKAGDVRKTALCQLCREKTCILLHFSAMNHAEMTDGLPDAFRRLMADVRIIKAGVGITGDGWKLNRDFGAQCEGLLCLSDMAGERLLPAKRWSLKDLLHRVSGSFVAKPEGVRCGNWEQHPLHPQQRTYAVVDAYAGLVIYQKLLDMPLLIRSEAVVPQAVVSVGQPLRSVGAVSVAQPDAAPAPDDGRPAKQLGPSKMNVYRLVRDGLSIDETATKIGLRESTVANYLYECLSSGGLPWEFEWLKIPLATAELVVQAAQVPPLGEEEETAAAAAPPPPPHVHGVARTALEGVPSDFGAALIQLAAQHAEAAATNAIEPGEDLPVFKAKKRRKGGVKAFFLQEPPRTPPPLPPAPPLLGDSEKPLAWEEQAGATGASILPMRLKDIKARLPEQVSYGDIRFVMLALHQGRLARHSGGEG